MQIELLERTITETKLDGTQISKLPSNEEMMNKINEIIDIINQMSSQERMKSGENFVKRMTSGW